MTTWRDRLVSASPFSKATAAVLMAAWVHTIGELVDLGLDHESLSVLTRGQRSRIAAVIAECRDEDIRRRFPPFGAAA